MREREQARENEIRKGEGLREREEFLENRRERIRGREKESRKGRGGDSKKEIEGKDDKGERKRERSTENFWEKGSKVIRRGRVKNAIERHIKGK